MLYNTFQDLSLSALGLGMMRLPVIDGDDAKVDETAAAEMIYIAIKSGINYFDTAWGYHNGNSELTAGKFLSRYPRENYYLASKFPGYDLSNMPKVEEIFQRQLEKCQCEYFDFYLFHNVYEGNVDSYLNPAYNILPYLLEQKAKGKIRHLGFSTHGSIEVMKKFLSAYGQHMEFCQIQLNYMDWHFQNAEEKVRLLNEANIPIWVMEPLRGGRLANAQDTTKEKLKALRQDETIPAWAFRFLQSIPGVTMILSGMSNMEQLKDNIETFATSKPLSETEFAQLVELADEETAKGGLPCTACHYCISHCPQELPIPELIALYNEHKVTGGGFIAPMSVGSMVAEKRPNNCIACKNCEEVCPQQIKISAMMSDFSKMLGL